MEGVQEKRETRWCLTTSEDGYEIVDHTMTTRSRSFGFMNK
jgi:hypothetical protein